MFFVKNVIDKEYCYATLWENKGKYYVIYSVADEYFFNKLEGGTFVHPSDSNGVITDWNTVYYQTEYTGTHSRVAQELETILSIREPHKYNSAIDRPIDNL
jgi:hypothetical protein